VELHRELIGNDEETTAETDAAERAWELGECAGSR
jgi:hypothetical protein